MEDKLKNTLRKEDVYKLSIPEFEKLVKQEREVGHIPDESWFRHHDAGRYL